MQDIQRHAATSDINHFQLWFNLLVPLTLVFALNHNKRKRQWHRELCNIDLSHLNEKRLKTLLYLHPVVLMSCYFLIKVCVLYIKYSVSVFSVVNFKNSVTPNKTIYTLVLIMSARLRLDQMLERLVK